VHYAIPERYRLTTVRLKDMEFASILGRGVKYLVLFLYLCLAGFLLWSVLVPRPLPIARAPPTAEEQAAQQQRMAAAQQAAKQKAQYERSLCFAAAACRKYDTMRLECATAGSFKTCLRIKMGDDADYSDICSGYSQGAPALPRPPETPNRVECFFLTMGR
jgi:hypothetical protein